MQNPITFMPTEPTGNQAKQVKTGASSLEASSHSFKQALSKEISEKQNTAKIKPATEPATKVENKAGNKEEEKVAAQDIKKDTSSQATKIEPASEDESKDGVTTAESVQTNGVQLIALVESLAQFAPKTAEKTIAGTSTELASIDATTANQAISKAANIIDLTVEKTNSKADPRAVIQDKFEVTSQQFGKNTPIATGEKTLDPSSPTEQLITAALQAADGKSGSLPQTTTSTGIELSAELKASLQDDLKSELKVDPKLNFRVDIKPDPKIALQSDLNADPRVGLKGDLKADLKTDLNANLKTELIIDQKVDPIVESKTDPKVNLNADPKADLKNDLKTDLKIDLRTQESGNIKEQNVKIAETSPSSQIFAQQIALSGAQVNVATEVMHLAPRIGTPAWDHSLGQKVVWMVAGGQQTAELTLNPPDLGPVQVVLSVNNDQANATFISAHPDVRDALESAMPKLRQMMNDAGVQLSGFSVKSESSNPGAQFAGDRSSSRAKNNEAQTVVGSMAIAASTNTMKNSTGNGIVDTFA
ncbi:MAG: flagellar hook-length control protein FliK [Pseudomonadota bacterium]